jgi:hypothetical protein
LGEVGHDIHRGDSKSGGKRYSTLAGILATDISGCAT